MCRGTSEKLKRKRLHNYILLNLLLAFFLAVGIHELLIQGGYARLNENTAAGDGFRRQSLNEEMLNYIQNTKDPGENLGLYWLETDFGTDPLKKTPDPELFSERKAMGRPPGLGRIHRTVQGNLERRQVFPGACAHRQNGGWSIFCRFLDV